MRYVTPTQKQPSAQTPANLSRLELLAAMLLVLLADMTIFRGGGYFGFALDAPII